MDIIDKIRKHSGPSDIDNFSVDIERRKNLNRDIKKILTKAFDGIDLERLSPELTWRYNRLKVRIQ